MELHQCLFGFQPAPFVSPNDDWMAANALSVPSDAFRDVIMPEGQENPDSHLRAFCHGQEATDVLEPMQNTSGICQLQNSPKPQPCNLPELGGKISAEGQLHHHMDEMKMDEMKTEKQNLSHIRNGETRSTATRSILFEALPAAESISPKSGARMRSSASPSVAASLSAPPGLSRTTSETTGGIVAATDAVFLQMNDSQNAEASLQIDAPQLPQIQQICPMPFEAPQLSDSLRQEEQVSGLGKALDAGSGEYWGQHDDLVMVGSVQGDAVTSEADETYGTVDGDGSIPEGRVDIDSLPVLSNPLQKSGRHTVIRGRLREDHPFAIAAKNLGYKLVSKEYEGQLGSKEEEAARVFLMSDLNAFLNEIGNNNFKIPVIGGGDLDVYMLIKEVTRLGGVHNVVRKRAFRIVAQQLGIPKTCTSAASVLKGAYEKLLFHYEQRLVYGKWPEDPEKAVNMKARICEEKLREKRAQSAVNPRSRRKSDERHPPGGPSLVIEKDPNKRSTDVERRIEDISTRCAPQRLLSLAINSAKEPFCLPAWASDFSIEEEPGELIKVAQRMSSDRVSNGSEAILYAVAECFEPAWSDDSEEEGQLSGGLCLARDICLLSPDDPNARKAQGFLFNLLVMVTGASGTAEGLRLTSNVSSEGLVEGLLYVLQDFYNKHLSGKHKIHVWDKNSRLPFTVKLTIEMTQNIAAAYCALRILSELSKDDRALVRLFKRGKLVSVSEAYLSHPCLHPVFVLSILDMVYNATVTFSENKELSVMMPALEDLLVVLEKSSSLRESLLRKTDSSSETTSAHDLAVSEKVLKTLYYFSLNWDISETVIPVYLDTLTRLLSRQILVSSLDCVAEVACNLVTLHPKAAAAHKGFVNGIIHLLYTGQGVDFAMECLKVMHGVKSLKGYTEQLQNLCKCRTLSEQHMLSITDILNDLFTSSNPEKNDHELATFMADK